MAAEDFDASSSAAFFAARHDGGVEAFTEAWGQVIDFVRSIDLDGLARGVESHLAVFAAMQVLLQFNACLRTYRIIDQVVEEREEFSAGHFSTPIFLDPFFLRK
jgi:hypothetical protein